MRAKVLRGSRSAQSIDRLMYGQQRCRDRWNVGHAERSRDAGQRDAPCPVEADLAVRPGLLAQWDPHRPAAVVVCRDTRQLYQQDLLSRKEVREHRCYPPGYFLWRTYFNASVGISYEARFMSAGQQVRDTRD